MDKSTFQKAAGINDALAERWWPHVDAALFEFGILLPHRVAAWIAQVGHESKGFSTLAESFDYSVGGLLDMFDKRLSPALAKTPACSLADSSRNAVLGGYAGPPESVSTVKRASSWYWEL